MALLWTFWNRTVEQGGNTVSICKSTNPKCRHFAVLKLQRGFEVLWCLDIKTCWACSPDTFFEPSSKWVDIKHHLYMKWLSRLSSHPGAFESLDDSWAITETKAGSVPVARPLAEAFAKQLKVTVERTYAWFCGCNHARVTVGIWCSADCGIETHSVTTWAYAAECTCWCTRAKHTRSEMNLYHMSGACIVNKIIAGKRCTVCGLDWRPEQIQKASRASPNFGQTWNLGTWKSIQHAKAIHHWHTCHNQSDQFNKLEWHLWSCSFTWHTVSSIHLTQASLCHKQKPLFLDIILLYFRT